MYEIGLYGLGVMGSALAENMIRHGFSIALYSKAEAERDRFHSPFPNHRIFSGVSDFVSHLEKPRKIFLMVTAGAPVDMVLEELLPLLSPGDIIMDGGNSYYRDTIRRCHSCQAAGIHFLGIGVSGGEEGARKGPSMMVGGTQEGYAAVRTILESIAAHTASGTCCRRFSTDGSGHYIKMVHNGIEYGILQLLAELLQLMRDLLQMKPEQIITLLNRWNRGRLHSYLTEICAVILAKKEEDGTLLVDRILDTAGQKGTGKWTIAESIDRGVYMPTIYEALMARNFSGQKALRLLGSRTLPGPPAHRYAESQENLSSVSEADFHKSSGSAPLPDPAHRYAESQKALSSMTSAASEAITEEDLYHTLLACTLLCYSQGLELIAKASEEAGWQIDLSVCMEAWSGGCIIRSDLLGEIRNALQAHGEEAPLPLLLLPEFREIGDLMPSLRKVVQLSAEAGCPLPATAASLHYYDAYRMAEMPVNYIQAMRDLFGAHTYQRKDREGHFHTVWE